MRRLAGAALAAAGAVAVINAAVTLAWQEPVGALRAQSTRAELGEQYAVLQAHYASPRTASVRSAMLGRSRAARLLDERSGPGAPLGRLRIRAIDMDLVWVQGTGTQSLERAPGHYAGTVLPGRRGTVGIAGHRTTHGAPFRHLDRLRRGDRIDASMPYGRYQYAVERTRIVSPREAEVLRVARSDRLVLTACHPLWSARQRIVVIARLVRWPNGPRNAPETTAPAPGSSSFVKGRARRADDPG